MLLSCHRIPSLGMWNTIGLKWSIVFSRKLTCMYTVQGGPKIKLDYAYCCNDFVYRLPTSITVPKIMKVGWQYCNNTQSSLLAHPVCLNVRPVVCAGLTRHIMSGSGAGATMHATNMRTRGRVFLRSGYVMSVVTTYAITTVSIHLVFDRRNRTANQTRQSLRYMVRDDRSITNDAICTAVYY